MAISVLWYTRGLDDGVCLLDGLVCTLLLLLVPSTPSILQLLQLSLLRNIFKIQHNLRAREQL